MWGEEFETGVFVLEGTGENVSVFVGGIRVGVGVLMTVARQPQSTPRQCSS